MNSEITGMTTAVVLKNVHILLIVPQEDQIVLYFMPELSHGSVMNYKIPLQVSDLELCQEECTEQVQTSYICSEEFFELATIAREQFKSIN